MDDAQSHFYDLAITQSLCAMLTFLQLSDIHFRGDGNAQDGTAPVVDYELRKLLIEDARSVAEATGGISGLLVCGDIANKGRGSEFIQASEWLQNLCAALNLDPWQVWVVPGNHDVDQLRISSVQQDFRERLRNADQGDIDRILKDVLADQSLRSTLIEPLENYQEFASAYTCMFGEGLDWRVDLALDSAQMVLRGINSALICGPGDDESRNRMVIGSDQVDIDNRVDLVNYTMCHHPHSWLLDGDEVDAAFRDRVQIRVTGHLHEKEVTSTSRGIYLQAGAVSPSRNATNEFVDPCIPRYDLIRLRVIDVRGIPHLELSLQGRVWRDDHWTEDAAPGGAANRRFDLSGTSSAVDLTEAFQGPGDAIIQPERELRFRLARLQSYDREQCALKIGAPIDEIAQAPAHLQVELLFSWTAREDLLASLWDAVISASLTLSPPDNPFRGI